MAFIEAPVFPLCVSFRPMFGPSWNTDVVVTNSGQETRNQNWSQPLQRGKVSFDARRPELIATVRKWLYLAQGSANGFRVRDTADYQVPDNNGTGVLNLVSGSVYQIYKRYQLDSPYFDRKIVKPEVGTFALYDAGVLKLLTTHYNIDESTGLVTISFSPAGALTWTGRFHVPVRFDEDAHQIEIIDRSTARGYIQGTQDLNLIELRL